MKLLFPFLIFSLLFSASSACKEIRKTVDPPGINVLIQDLPCQEVLNRIQTVLKEQSLPSVWKDKAQGLLSIGPIITQPLPNEPFSKMEEKFFLDIKCRDPLRTRISLLMELRGLTPADRWEEIKDPVKLNAYGQRFWNNLHIP